MDSQLIKKGLSFFVAVVVINVFSALFFNLWGWIGAFLLGWNWNSVYDYVSNHFKKE